MTVAHRCEHEIFMPLRKQPPISPPPRASQFPASIWAWGRLREGCAGAPSRRGCRRDLPTASPPWPQGASGRLSWGGRVAAVAGAGKETSHWPAVGSPCQVWGTTVNKTQAMGLTVLPGGKAGPKCQSSGRPAPRRRLICDVWWVQLIHLILWIVLLVSRLRTLCLVLKLFCVLF